jgi:glycosyltransferase involved in cell wall biosynthesis
MQHNSYPVVDALALLENKSNIPWIYSCWGNDIFLYHNKPEHQMRIRAVLERCDYLMADCQRDEKLARNYGFSGKFLGVFPGGGGFPVKDLQIYRQTQRPSERRVIAVKGYQTHGGQALTALDAIERCAEHLKRFQVIVHSSQPVVSAKVEQLKNRLSIPIDVMPRSSHIEMSKLFGRSRVALGVSASDGTPNTMLEAMIMGAFPIQTNPGGATAEWVEDGVNGFLIPHDDPASIAESLVRALENDRLVDEAAGINYRLMLDKIDTFVVHPRVIDAYRTVLSYA